MTWKTAMNVKCPKCGENMYIQPSTYCFYEGWRGHPEYDSPMDVNYEVQHEVTFLCYNSDCQPSEGEVE